ncbi:asparagine synthase-related protein (plasmid) [Haloarcula salina]|uniref:asparagine synthase-related protein n=1 Tax=Haloarcula salina TaxID=1429914 RepID=UPI003C6FFF81
MSGMIGGTVNGSRLQEAVSELGARTREKSWLYEHGGSGLGLSYTTADPQGVTVWDDGSRAGVVFGVVTNRSELGISETEVFDRLLDRPKETARALEGEFLIACYDSDRDSHVVVTDKLGARSCYYTTDDGVYYATDVDVLLPFLDEPELDRQGASDMLLMGHMWGERTLVEGVRAMRPATVMEVTNGTLATSRYWKPEYEPAETGSAYFDELADRYRQAARRFGGTLPENAGIWLSGGLDSRTTAAALLDEAPDGSLESLTAYGYDANPPTNDNPRIAREIAETLGIEYSQIPLSAETFGEDFERVIEATDGMLRWNTTANLSPTYHIRDDVPVLMEGMQGELIGDHLLRYHLDDAQSIVEAQQNSEASTDVETVENLLTVDVDPLATFKAEAERTPERTHRGKVLDIHFQNYYARLGLASNRVMRDWTGNRVVQVDGDYLEWCAKIPQYYRKGTFPLSQRVFQSDAGGVPYGTSIAKLELCRRISPELSEITYERTKTKPSRPYHLHVGGFVGNVVVNRLRSKPTYANGQLQDFWIRDTDTYVHRRVTELIDAAMDRDLFDADAVEAVYSAHMDGANNATLLAQITTLEYWIQEHLD